MTSAVPWSVKGIDRKARETAKDLARKSGMTLGEWLNQMIEYQGEGKVTPLPATNNLHEAVERLAARIDAAETRATLAVTGIDQSVRGLVARLEAAEREQAAARGEGHDRLAARIKKLEDEASGPRANEALRALEGSIGRIAGQVYESEAAQKDALAAIRAELGQLGARVQAVETGGKAQLLVGEAERRLQQMEEALHETRLQVQKAEQRSAQAVERLGHEMLRMVETVDKNMQAVEGRTASAVERLGGDVARIADQLEARLKQADDAQAQALEKLGAEIERITGKLSDRLTTVERRSAQDADAAHGEAKWSPVDELPAFGGFDDRIRETEARTAEVLAAARERIHQRLDEAQDHGERLPEPIVTASEFAAAAEMDIAFDEPTEAEAEPEPAYDPFADIEATVQQVMQPEDTAQSDEVAEIDEPAPRASALANAAPAPVIYPQSAAARFDYVFAPPNYTPVEAEPQDDAPADAELEQAAEAEPEPSSPPIGAFDSWTQGDDPFAAAELESADPFEIAGDVDSDGPAAAEETRASSDDFAPEAADEFVTGDADPFAPSDPFAPAQAFDAGDDFLLPPEPRRPEPAATQPQAEASAEDPALGPFGFEPEPEELAPPYRAEAFAREEQDEFVSAAAPQPQPMSRTDFLERAREAARSASEGEARRGGGFALGFGSRRRGGSKTKNVLFMSTAVLVCAVSGWFGVTMLAPELKTEEAAGSDATSDARAAVALDPKPLGARPAAPSAAVTPIGPLPTSSNAGAAAGSNADLVYADAVRQLELKDPKGLETLRKAAELGHAPAQLHLARLYDTGQGGLVKNMVEARRWTEKAAQAGLPKAMHNLAMYYFNGDGGQRSTTVAAQWFRNAAELGLVDSQYNLGLLYEKGIGLAPNAAEAYKWYLLASRSGDPTARSEAREAALRVRPLLSTDAQAAAERAAGAYRVPVQQADAR